MHRLLLRAAAAAAGPQQSQCVAPALAQAHCCWQQQAGGSSRRVGTSSGSRRAAAAAEQPDAAGSGVDEDVGDKVRQLADDIIGLSVLECSQLSKLLRDRLGLPRSGGMGMPMMMPGLAAGAAPAAGAGAAAAAAPEPEEKKEKTEFDVKLESFTPEGKIKVIKEIRALTSLGLKEAKELVEKAPVVVKAAVSKADAEAMKKQLEAVGGKVVME